MTLLSAIIFDLDGVLVNTNDLHYQAWRAVAESEGRQFTPSDMEALRGVRRDQCVKMIFPDLELTLSQIESFLQIKHTTYTQALFQQTPQDLLIDNAIDLLQATRDKGLKLGLASSSVNALRVLEQVDLVRLFDSIAGGETVMRSKPEPDIFLWVAGALGVYPQEALIFEDSVAGVKAAKRAGMQVVGVANPDLETMADRYFPSLSEIDIDTLLVDLDLTIASPLQTSLIGDQHVRD